MYMFARSDQKTLERELERKSRQEKRFCPKFSPYTQGKPLFMWYQLQLMSMKLSAFTGAGQCFCEKYQVLDNSEITNPEQIN